MHSHQSANEETSKAWANFVQLFYITTVLTFLTITLFWLKFPLTNLSGYGFFWTVSLAFGFVLSVPAFLIGAAFFHLTTPILETYLPSTVTFIATGTVTAFLGVVMGAFLIGVFSGSSNMLSLGFGVGGTAAVVAFVVSSCMVVKGL